MPEAADLHLNIFIDALGWPLAQQNDFLPELSAVRQPVTTVLGYSSGAVPTILSGLLPQQHGCWSFFTHDPARSPFRWMTPLGLLPHRVAAHHRLRSPLSRVVRRALGYTGYFNLYAVPFGRIGRLDYTEKRDLFVPGGIAGGETVWCAARAANRVVHVSDWRAPEEDNLASARAAVRDPALRHAFVYLPALDGALHLGGHAVAPPRLARYADEVRRLIREARAVHPKVVTRLFSDHGMAEVRRVVDLRAVLERGKLEWGRDFVALYDSTMVRFWWCGADPKGVEAEVRRRLRATRAGRFLSKPELHELGIDFPGARFGEAMFLCHPGTLVVPSDMGLSPIAGMHGYHPDDVDSDGVLLSDHALPVPVERIDDLNTLMRADLGLPAAAGAPGAAAAAVRRAG